MIEPNDPVTEPRMFEMYKANSSAIRFQVRLPYGYGIANFALSSRSSPKKELYQFTLGMGSSCTFIDATRSNDHRQSGFNLADPGNGLYEEFWLTWHNGVIRFGNVGQRLPLFTYADNTISKSNIGYVKFYSTTIYRPVHWIFEASPVVLKQIEPKDFESGTLRWERMTDGHLPQDAMIGGFENEPIYIARAGHAGSLCPGKYCRSKQLAFVPWGGREHAKEEFEILCGFNAKWVRTRDRFIPENAFIAGTSEIRNEPLYIGRSVLEGNLITGKVHVLYSTCYLPYKGLEVEVGQYEILVTCQTPRGIQYIPDE